MKKTMPKLIFILLFVSQLHLRLHILSVDADEVIDFTEQISYFLVILNLHTKGI